MSETRWSPEPWGYGKRGNSVRDAKDEIVVWLEGSDLQPEDSRRLIAAVNACAGIPTEALEAGALTRALAMLGEFAVDHHLCHCGVEHTEVCGDLTEVLRALGRINP